MKYLIEIRPGEGGEDAKLLTKRQASIYQAFAVKHALNATLQDTALG